MFAASILADAHKGYNLSIRARAGSGKTTTILSIAKALSGKKIEILTYNRALSNECTAKITQQGIDAACHTIHAKFSRCCGLVCNDDFGLLEQAKIERFDADVVMIDEVQDLRPLLLEALLKMIPLDKQIIVVGDELQILYDYCMGDEATDFVLMSPEIAFMNVSKREWKTHELYGSFRLTASCAVFVNCIWNSNIHSLSKEEDSPVDLVIASPWSDKVTRLIRKTIDHYGSSNTMILNQSLQGNCPLRSHVNRLLKQGYLFHIKEFARGFDNSEDFHNKTRVWSYCSSKGCEADAVIVFGADICPAGNDLGVACSRAKKKMIVIQNDRSVVNEIFKDIPYHMRFMQVNHFGDLVHHNSEICFGPIEKREIQNNRFAVSDRLNTSPRVLYDLFHSFEFQTQHVHEGTPLNTVVKFGDYSEDVSALYGKQLEYLLQVHTGHMCSDAHILQISGAQVTHAKQLADYFDKHSIMYSNLDDLQFPLSAAAIKRKCSTREILLSKNGKSLHLVSDPCDKVHAIHAGLQESKSSILAMELANHVLALDSYEDRKTLITSYDWVSECVDDMVKHVLDSLPNLHHGVFEHMIQYKHESSSGGVCVNGKVDWVYEQTVVDFKMTAEMCSDHKFQIITYAAMHAFNTGADSQGIIYYVRLGITMTVQMSYSQASVFLKHYVHIRLFGTLDPV